MRHGQSTANVAGIIISNLEDGKKNDYALTTLGEQKVRDTLSREKSLGILDAQTILVSSPFSRTLRTAEIAKEILGASEVTIDDRLRERWFGDWDKKGDAAYLTVWEGDQQDPHQTADHIESACAVQTRALAVIEDLEERYRGETILLISHGDTLHLLLTGLYNQSPATHREIPPLSTAEIREIEI